MDFACEITRADCEVLKLCMVHEGQRKGEGGYLGQILGHNKIRHVDPVEQKVSDHCLHMLHRSVQVPVLQKTVQDLCYELSNHQAVVSSNCLDPLHESRSLASLCPLIEERTRKTVTGTPVPILMDKTISALDHAQQTTRPCRNRKGAHLQSSLWSGCQVKPMDKRSPDNVSTNCCGFNNPDGGIFNEFYQQVTPPPF